MKRLGNLGTFLLFLLGLVLLLTANSVRAQGETPSAEDIVRGALLYDRWYAVLGVDAPADEMPLWSRQSTNTRSGADTWRCVECHGWDYRGAQGAYGSGSHYTGFPDVMSLAADLDVEEIVAHLEGANDPAHDFLSYLDNRAMTQLAIFLKYGTIDDSLYIDPVSLQVIGADVVNGQELYESTCAACHGTDGATIVFRSEGIDETLGAVANRDPWRFLHRTRFGVAGTPMPVGYDLGWTPGDGRDVLAYVQALGSGQQATTPAPAADVAEPAQQVGGPATGWGRGILTGLLAFLGTVGGSLLFLSIVILLGFLVVTILRRRK